MKKTVLFVVLVVASMLGLPPVAQAAAPYLTLAAQSNSYYQMTVNSANAYSSVDFYTRESGTDLWTVFHNLGTTDSSGYFSTSLYISSFKPSVVREGYAVVGGISSSTVSTGSSGNYSGSLTFSPNSVSLSAGTSATVYVSGGSGSGLYVLSNSNSSVASVSVVNNSQLSVYGYSAGYASVQVCALGYSACGYLSVNVSGSASGTLTFSQSTVYVSQGSSASVAVLNVPANQGLYIASNSNSSVASASIGSGNSVSVYGVSAGSASVQVCAGSGAYCGYFAVQVTGGTVGNITFSPSYPSLSVNQSLTVSINTPYLYSGGYYLSQNSNPSAVSASVSGSSVYLYGNSSGYASLSICQTSGSACGNLPVNVSGGETSGLSFNPSALTLSLGANSGVYVSGSNGQNLYLSSNSNPSVASVTINNQNSVTVYAANAGTTTMRLCTVSSQVCGNLPVYVSSGGSYYNTLSFTTTSLPAGSVGSFYQSQVLVSGGVSPYTFEVASGTLPAGLSMSSMGAITGTPTTRSQYFFTVRVTDNYGRQGSQAFSVEIFGGSVLGSYTFQNGLIIQSGPTVYIVYKNAKTPFASRSAFEGLGFRFSQISCADCGYVPDSGRTVWTAASAHPWGAWVKSGQTIYFVHADGLMPISSYDVFLNNGGQDYLAVPMNSYDAVLPRLSVMTYNDARLR